jgi:hypothetical protein
MSSACAYREDFPVTNPYLDAPDGAQLDLTGSNHDHPDRHGWYERCGDTWVPIEQPDQLEVATR